MATVEKITPDVVTANKPKDYSGLMGQYNKVTGPSQTLAGYDEWKKKRLEQVPQSGENSGGDHSNSSSFLSGFSGLGAKAGDFLAGIGDSLGGEKYGSFSEDEKAAQSSIRSALEMIPGYGTAIAAATGLVDAVGSATGLNLSSVNKDTAERAGIKGTEFNKIMNMLPGNSIIWGGISRLAGNKRTETLDVSDDIMSMADGFSGTINDFKAAQDLGNKQLFFDQTKKANEYINSQRSALSLMNRIQKTNTQRKESDYYQDLQNQNINRYAGNNYLNTHVGKKGMKLMSVEEARRIANLKLENNSTEKLQNGGNIPGIDKSIIPEGSLHARKNNLAELNPDLEDATKKGIPVMVSEGGQISGQTAEIEKEELIFRLEITQKLEELMKDGSEEAMIEAGKIITCEIIKNTQDNAEQITEDLINE